jgi:hypothetical protein
MRSVAHLNLHVRVIQIKLSHVEFVYAPTNSKPAAPTSSMPASVRLHCILWIKYLRKLAFVK